MAQFDWFDWLAWRVRFFGNVLPCSWCHVGGWLLSATKHSQRDTYLGGQASTPPLTPLQRCFRDQIDIKRWRQGELPMLTFQ